MIKFVNVVTLLLVATLAQDAPIEIHQHLRAESGPSIGLKEMIARGFEFVRLDQAELEDDGIQGAYSRSLKLPGIRGGHPRGFSGVGSGFGP
jgi:hypothetical protein